MTRRYSLVFPAFVGEPGFEGLDYRLLELLPANANQPGNFSETDDDLATMRRLKKYPGADVGKKQ